MDCHCKDNNIFLLILKDAPIPTITIKLPSEKGLELQGEYNIVSQSYLNLQNWIDVDIDNNLPVAQVEAWIKESYDIMQNEAKQAENDKYISLSNIMGIK